MTEVLADSRTVFIITFIAIAGMVTSGHLTGSIYPGMILFLFFGIVGLLVCSAYGQSLQAIIGSVILLAVGFRIYSMMIPASLIGDDPVSNSIWIQRLIEAGSVNPIGSGFYTDAPLYYVLAAISSIVLDISSADGVIVYPLVIGIIVPLIVVSMSKSIGIDNTRLLAVAVLLAPITTEAVRRSYWPIAQSQASIFWWLFLLVLLWHIKSPSKRFYGLVAFFTIATAFTHKLPLPIIGATVFILIFLMNVDRLSFSGVDKQSMSNQMVGIASLISVITVGQWLYASDLIDQITLRISQFVIGLATVSAPAGGSGAQEPSAALPARPGILADIYQYPAEYGLYFERSHAIVLLLVAGVGWGVLYLFTRRTEERNAIQLLLAASAICVFLVALGQVSVGAMNPTRPLLLIEPVLVTLIVGLIYYLPSSLSPKRSGVRTGLLYAGIILLVGSQIFTASAAADYPNTPRYYLDEPEQQATEIMCRYGEDTVYVDQEVQALTHCGKFDRISRSSTDPLYNAEIEPDQHGTVLYRHNVDVYLGMYSRWKLTWNPGEELPKEYHTVYDNGQVSTYNSNSS